MNEEADTPKQNTDRRLWRKDPDNPLSSPEIHVTASGAIGINVGGMVIVQPVERWHELAMLDINSQIRQRLWSRLRTSIGNREASCREWLAAVDRGDREHASRWLDAMAAKLTAELIRDLKKPAYTVRDLI